MEVGHAVLTLEGARTSENLTFCNDKIRPKSIILTNSY